MSNLGAYQEITTLAARVGGVDKLVQAIGNEAVQKRGPSLVVAGAAIATGVVLGGQWAWRRYQSVRAAGRESEAELRAMAGEPTPNSAEPDTTEAGIAPSRTESTRG